MIIHRIIIVVHIVESTLVVGSQIRVIPIDPGVDDGHLDTVASVPSHSDIGCVLSSATNDFRVYPVNTPA